jgi:hypothetical protein
MYKKYHSNPPKIDDFIYQCKSTIENKISLGEKFLNQIGQDSNVISIRNAIGKRMDKCGGIIRNLKYVRQGKSEAENALNNIADDIKISSVNELPYCFQNYDLLISQIVFLSSIESYIENGGNSRGSYLIYENEGKSPEDILPDLISRSIPKQNFRDRIQVVRLNNKLCEFEWEPVRPIPEDESWFETAWDDFSTGNILR